ncbi:MAG: DUF2497 domain-containing protein [Alphaproteobacteria bacterium]|nr:DUF2497 domain-containing protein [Alphaproteobacteria bacterium]
MQDEQSVSEILSSIRQVLSKEAASLKNDTFIDSNSTGLQNDDEVVFELTPQMQVAQGTLIDTETAVRTQEALSKLNQLQSPTPMVTDLEQQLRPMLRDWLNTHLPEIVERIVTQEVQRIINHR